MHLLVIEDERALCETIVRSLRRLAYSVDYCYDGEKALELLGVERYDLVLLDLNLPGKDGMTVLRTLRQTDRETRVLILSARGEVEDKVEGLDAGANDYLAKPFNTDELLARIRALGRRKGEVTTPTGLTFGDIELDTSALTLSCASKEINLTLKESELLEYLMTNKSTVLSKDMIIEKLWGFDSEAEANHVEVYISFLRKKLKYLGSKTSIVTVRGVGYSLKEE